MKPEIAIATLKSEYCPEMCDEVNYCENCEINAAIEALEKQIPKPIAVKKLNETVTIGRATFGKGTTILAMCPSCGSWVNKHHRYCQECGQAIKLEVLEQEVRIMKYRKKPVIIEAVQYTCNNYDEVCDFVGKRLDIKGCGTSLIIETLEGNHIASVGDYIIKGVQGEFYPCKPDIFEQTYEVAE